MSLHLDHLLAHCDVSGRDVLDVGAGDGAFAYSLSALGATVTGIEIDAAKVERAQARHGQTVQMRVGRGEALPVADESQDLVCLMFSFHHVPAPVQPAAFAEVHRVLRPGGRCHVVDPLPLGSMFDVVKFIDDETEVRTHSHARLRTIGTAQGFEPVAAQEYVLERVYADFDALLGKVVGVDDARAARLPEVRADMERAFDASGQKTDNGVMLSQPCVAYHFQKI